MASKDKKREINMVEPAKTKEINGRIYTRYGFGYTSKRAADEIAARMKGWNDYIRVIKTVNGYAIYKSPKKKK